MDKTEYKRIINYLDEGKIDELREYLDNRMDYLELKNTRKVIMDLINDDCIREYSKYRQSSGRRKMEKTYIGILEETDNGIVMLHKGGNLFNLYNNELIDDNIEEIMERSNKLRSDSLREDQLASLQRILSTVDDKYQRGIAYTSECDQLLEAYTQNEDISVLVPIKYYTFAHQLLGEETKEYTNNNGTGIYLKSTKGKALILKMEEKTKKN